MEYLIKFVKICVIIFSSYYPLKKCFENMCAKYRLGTQIRSGDRK